MRRATADYLETRICPDHIWVSGSAIAADAIAYLRRGLVWTLVYDAGRLLGEVSTIDYPVGRAQRKLDDEPIRIVPDDDVQYLDMYDFVATGDRDGCLRRLANAVAHTRSRDAAGEQHWRWPHLASLCRLLTGDDAAAMSLLENAPLVGCFDDWRAIFGASGEARIQRAKGEVLEAIERAFDGVPFPGEKRRSLHQAQAADSWAGCDQSRDHVGRWQDIPREHILDCQFALPHLDAEGLPYYLPAIMSFVVREHDQRRADHQSGWIFESVEYSLQFNLDRPDLRDNAAKRYRLLTREQLAAVACFADYYRCSHEDRQRWHALARGGDWPAAIVT